MLCPGCVTLTRLFPLSATVSQRIEDGHIDIDTLVRIQAVEAIGVQNGGRAANRVSASKLWEVARALQTSVVYFYEGLGDPSDPESQGPRASVQDFLLTPEGLELAGADAEGPRGDIWTWLRLEGGQIASAFQRDPGWLHLPLLEGAVRGADLADWKLVRASFGISHAGMDL